jgi:hypothetical protein
VASDSERLLALRMNAKVKGFDEIVRSPSFSLFGEGTIEALFGAISGLLPDFWLLRVDDLEYDYESTIDEPVNADLELGQDYDTMEAEVVSFLGDESVLDGMSHDALFLSSCHDAWDRLAAETRFVDKSVQRGEYDAALARLSIYYWLIYGHKFVSSVNLLRGLRLVASDRASEVRRQAWRNSL